MLEIELSNHLTVCKQINDVLIELLGILSNTWSYFPVCKSMMLDSFKIVSHKICSQIIYIYIYIYIYYICIKWIWN